MSPLDRTMTIDTSGVSRALSKFCTFLYSRNWAAILVARRLLEPEMTSPFDRAR